MEYSGAEIRVVGLLWRGGGDEEECWTTKTPSSQTSGCRGTEESWLIHLYWNCHTEQIMRIKQKLDAQARSDAIVDVGRALLSQTKTMR